MRNFILVWTLLGSAVCFAGTIEEDIAFTLKDQMSSTSMNRPETLIKAGKIELAEGKVVNAEILGRQFKCQSLGADKNGETEALCTIRTTLSISLDDDAMVALAQKRSELAQNETIEITSRGSWLKKESANLVLRVAYKAGQSWNDASIRVLESREVK